MAKLMLPKLVVTKLLVPLQVGKSYELIRHVVELSKHSLNVNPLQQDFHSPSVWSQPWFLSILDHKKCAYILVHLLFPLLQEDRMRSSSGRKRLNKGLFWFKLSGS